MDTSFFRNCSLGFMLVNMFLFRFMIICLFNGHIVEMYFYSPCDIVLCDGFFIFMRLYKKILTVKMKREVLN